MTPHRECSWSGHLSLWLQSAFLGLNAQAPAHRQRETPYSGSTTNPDIDHSPPDDDSSLPFSDLVDAFTPADPLPPLDHEFHYVAILNRILPRVICVLAWSPVSVRDILFVMSATFRAFR